VLSFFYIRSKFTLMIVLLYRTRNKVID